MKVVGLADTRETAPNPPNNSLCDTNPDDENEYGRILNKQHNVYCYDPLTTVGVTHDDSDISVARAPIDARLLLIPINLHNLHWALAFVLPKQHTYCVYDPKMGGRYDNVVMHEKVAKWVRKHTSVDRLSAVCLQDFPVQRDDNSCGVFILGAMASLSERVAVNFTQADIPLMRKHIMMSLIPGNARTQLPVTTADEKEESEKYAERLEDDEDFQSPMPTMRKRTNTDTSKSAKGKKKLKNRVRAIIRNRNKLVEFALRRHTFAQEILSFVVALLWKRSREEEYARWNMSQLDGVRQLGMSS